jgi:hypothetical protein
MPYTAPETPVNTLAATAPSVFYPQLIHAGTGTMAAEFPLRFGEGSTLPVSILPTGMAAATVRIGNSAITQPGATARTLRLTDADGSLVPEWLATVDADESNNTVTPVELGISWHGLSAAPTLPAGCYQISARIVCRTTATTNGVQLTLTGSTATVVATAWSMPGVVDTHLAAFPAVFAATSSPAANEPFLVRVEGVFVLAVPGTAPSLWFNSETAATVAEVLEGSAYSIRKIA